MVFRTDSRSLYCIQDGSSHSSCINKAAVQGDWLFKDLVTTQHLSQCGPMELKAVAFPLRAIVSGESQIRMLVRDS
jgi:hypothetical protein